MTVSVKELRTNPFTIFDKDWALITAGDINNHNSMTVSWGEMGTLWSTSVITVYVKPCRYTHKFFEENDYFVVSFFEEKYRKALSIMGSRSGRDVNKDELSGLTPISHDNVTIYKEAKMTFICKKIYFNDLHLENVPEEYKKKYYEIDKPHTMYVGEVIEVIGE